MNLNHQTRIARLREVEVLGYRLCYLLLGGEQEAHAAAEELLARLYRSELFFTADPAGQAALLRSEAADVCAGRRRVGVGA